MKLPKYMVYESGSLFPYDHALSLLADIRAKGASPALFKRVQGSTEYYRVMLIEDLKRLAAEESHEVRDDFTAGQV